MSAGLIAAAGHRVTIYERMPSPARKFLMAGRGGLNLTHSENFETFLTRYGPARDWLEPALRAFNPQALRHWADALDQQTFIGSSGRVFPKAMKASPLLRAWLAQLNAAGVTLVRNHDWDGWANNGDLMFKTGSDSGTRITRPDALMLALGGASWPRLGSNGTWSQILSAQGIKLAPFEPSNCGFKVTWSAYFADKFQGTPLKNIALNFNDQTIRGEVLITTQGIEGGAVYALSRELRDAIKAKGEATLKLDLCPEIDLDDLHRRLARPRGKTSISNHLRKRIGLTSLAAAFLREGANNDLPDTDLELAILIKGCPLRLTGYSCISRAISSAGGVRQSAIDDAYMLKDVPGIFAAGEMLDWEAPTGGYLLQATFATAVCAATGLNAWLETNETSGVGLNVAG